MLDFGTGATHSNKLSFPDQDLLDAMPAYSVGFKLRPRAGPWTDDRTLLAKRQSGNDGFMVRGQVTAGKNVLNVLHGNGTSIVASGESVTDLVSTATFTIVITWDGTTIIFYVNDVLDASLAFSTTIAANASPLFLGNENTNNGLQCALGNVMIWPNYILTAEERRHFHRGNKIPREDKLVFWHRGIVVPGFDVALQAPGTTGGTVLLLSDPEDSNFKFNFRWRQVASELLVAKAADSPVYSLRVPIRWLKLPLGGLFNVSHDAMLRSRSHLAGLEEGHQLVDAWRRGLVRLLGVTEHRRDRALTLEFEDAEEAIATLFLSARTTGNLDVGFGIAQMSQGAAFISIRQSDAYILSDAAIGEANDEVTPGQTEGVYIEQRIKDIGKFNHLGLLCESAIANKVVDPAFVNGTTSYTEAEAGGGSVNVVTNRRVFPSFVTGNSIEVIGAAVAENSFRQTFAVLASEGFGRVSFLYSDRTAGAFPHWQLQRSSDNQWWDDVNNTFNGSNIINNAPTSFDTVNTLERVKRFVSKPIPISSDQNWTVRLGKHNLATTHNFYHLNVTPGKLRYSHLINTTTTAADVVADELDLDVEENVRQLMFAGRGTISLELVAEQDGGDLVDGTNLALMVIQYGISGKDFLAVLYQKLASQNVRFSFERWRDVSGTSTLDVRATKDVMIVRGTAYRIAARIISEDRLELGLAARTMRLSIDGVNGTDAVATAMFSTTERFTKAWYGCAPASTGFSPSMNYLFNFRCQPRVVTDEELLSL